MKADAGYLPLFWRGLTVRSDGLLVRGQETCGPQAACGTGFLSPLFKPGKIVLELLNALYQ